MPPRAPRARRTSIDSHHLAGTPDVINARLSVKQALLVTTPVNTTLPLPPFTPAHTVDAPSMPISRSRRYRKYQFAPPGLAVDSVANGRRRRSLVEDESALH